MGIIRSGILCTFLIIFVSECDGGIHRAERHSDSSEEDENPAEQEIPNPSSVSRSQTIVDIRMPAVRTTKVNLSCCITG